MRSLIIVLFLAMPFLIKAQASDTVKLTLEQMNKELLKTQAKLNEAAFHLNKSASNSEWAMACALLSVPMFVGGALSPDEANMGIMLFSGCAVLAIGIVHQILAPINLHKAGRSLQLSK